MGLRITLTPGIHMVPKVIADYYRQLQVQRKAQQARENLFRLGPKGEAVIESPSLIPELRRIDEEYGAA